MKRISGRTLKDAAPIQDNPIRIVEDVSETALDLQLGGKLDSRLVVGLTDVETRSSAPILAPRDDGKRTRQPIRVRVYHSAEGPPAPPGSTVADGVTTVPSVEKGGLSGAAMVAVGVVGFLLLRSVA